MMDYILNRYIDKLITGSLDNFFEKLSECYDERRQILKESFPEAGGLAIDYVLGKQFGPTSASEWLALYSNPVETSQRKHKKNKSKQDANGHDEDSLTKAARQILLVYLRYDLVNAQTKIPASTIDKISSLPQQFNFPYSVIRIATGLWAIDNADPSLALKSFSLPSIDFGPYLPDNSASDLVKIVLTTLTIDHNPKVALQLCNIRLHENWDENLYVQHVLHVREKLNLVSVANSTCDASSQVSGRRTPSRPKATREFKKTISFEDSPARNTRLRKGKIK